MTNTIHSIVVDGLSFALPLFIIAIGGIYSERSGVVNLALEGLLGFGAFTGGLFVAATAGYFAAASNAPMYLSFLIAAAGGALFATLHAVLSIKFHANQVISGVVVNIVAVALTGFLTSTLNALFFGSPSVKFMLKTSPRWTVPVLSDIPVLGAVFTNFYPFELIILLVALFMWYLLYRTRFGMHVRAAGDNPQALEGAGIDVARVRFIAVLISGAMSGIGGMAFAYSISTNFSPAVFFGGGFIAIAALIFGNWQILPTLLACLIFGFARSSAYALVLRLNADASVIDLAMITPYLITLLLLVFFGKTNRAPRALGEIYDKSKR